MKNMFIEEFEIKPSETLADKAPLHDSLLPPVRMEEVKSQMLVCVPGSYDDPGIIVSIWKMASEPMRPIRLGKSMPFAYKFPPAPPTMSEFCQGYNELYGTNLTVAKLQTYLVFS